MATKMRIAMVDADFPLFFRRHFKVFLNFKNPMSDSFFSCRNIPGYQVSYKSNDKQNKYPLPALSRHFNRRHSGIY